MLSSQLLTILRTYWRLAQPKHWLFLGRDETRPIETAVLHTACRSTRAAAGLSKQVTVHTLRHSLAGEIAFQNKAVVYAILFRTAAETLATIAADPRHLGAQLGVIAVLHTWGQTLQHHPHVHCVVPGGGPSLDGTLGGLPARLFPARARALASVPPPVPASPAERL
jgi:Putative transposase/Phage integrase family